MEKDGGRLLALIGEEEKQEIIIIKRGGDHDDGHHGGAWKIAFADFMTAMMALFLVLWLVNAANEETKKSVASYFNPVKLVDRNRSTKGLNEMSGGPIEASETTEDAVETAKGEATEGNEQAQKHTDAELSENPYKVLAEIAERKDDSTATTAVSQDDSGQAASAADLQYQDPFAPDFWNKEARQIAEASSNADEQMPDAETKTAAIPVDESGLENQTETTKAGADVSKSDSGSDSGHQDQPAEQTSKMDKSAGDAEGKTLGAAEDIEDSGKKAEEEFADAEKARSKSQEIVDEIKKAIDQAFGESEAIVAGLTVEQVNEGALISITDQLGWSMFEVGSAVPRRDLVLAMEKIAGVLAAQDGNIRLRGHTDGRQFAGDSFGNWRLSATRAQTAYHMLVRAGFDGGRVSQITGFADRQLKSSDEPLAAINRRIEILLEVPQ